MKIIAIFSLLMLFSITSFSQENAIINIGVGMPVFFEINFDSNSGGTHTISPKRINLIFEKPKLFVFKQNINFSVTPGAGYLLFNESGSGGGLGGGSSKLYKHQAISLYTKFLYEKNLNANHSFNFYGGFLSGIYLLTKTTGEESWWAIQELHNRNGSKEIDRNGKNFFHTFYMGFLIGIRPNIKSTPFLKPVLEISFLPNYATIIDSHLVIEEQNVSKSMAMISLIVGFGHKKKLPK